VLYPRNFEQKIGFDQIRERISNYCESDWGKEKVSQIRLSTSSTFIERFLNQTDEMLKIISFEENFPFDHCLDLKEPLKKIDLKGQFLEINELHALRLNLITCNKIISFLKEKKTENKYENLYFLTKNIQTYPFVKKRIDQVINTKGELKDNASEKLKNIRQKISSLEKSISGKLHHILKELKSQGWVEEDTTLNIREGRTVVPVDASVKRKISGIIQDESASGKTVYIEPTEIVEINNQIKELQYEEKREIVKILVAIKEDIRPYVQDIYKANEFLATMDFITAKAHFAKDIEAIKPAVVDNPHIRWIEAIHPLLLLNFRKEKRKVTPLDITLDKKEQRILLISGPNAGGKSVCLKTVGLLQYMFQCGLLIPAKTGTEMGIFKKIFINIGDDQSIDNDLSTYSSHLLNIKTFIKQADANSLILIDEFGAGTEPVLGGSIAESILTELNNKKIMGVITTHYSNLKHYASSAEGIENGAMLFDTDKMTPLYKLSIGEPGSSFAFEIAKKIGLPDHVLKRASEKIGKKHIDYDKNLKDIIRDKRYWEKKRNSIKQKEKNLEKLLNEYAEKLENAKKTQKEIQREAKQEASQLMSQVNKKIENTIKQIKESNAEKEKTKEIRKNFENFKEKINQEKIPDNLDSKLKKVQKEKKHLQNEPDIKKEKKETSKTRKPKLEKGVKVKHKKHGTVGEVMDTNKKSILIGFGNLITTVPPEELEIINENEYSRHIQKTESESISKNFDLGKRKMEFNTEIDVRGKRADEAMHLIKDFIDEAIVLNVSSVRILHGKGNGILRQIIRQYLDTFDLVKNYKDERVEFGGAGITVVELEY